MFCNGIKKIGWAGVFLAYLALCTGLWITRSDPVARVMQGVLVLSGLGLGVWAGYQFYTQFQEMRTREAMWRSKLEHTEALATIGYMAAGITHELKNPLNFVLNFSELSLELMNDITTLYQAGKAPSELGLEWDELKINIQTILNHARRAESIMNNILLYARENKKPEAQRTDINQLLEECFQLSFHAEKSHRQQMNIRIVKKFDDTLGDILTYKADIGRAFINLISNALFALYEKHDRDPDFQPMVELITERQNGWVKIAIRDNGPGIAPTHIPHIFAPFYSTKSHTEGTGLGLAITHDIVERHQGQITVTSQLDTYTEFTILIPWMAAPAAAETGAPA